MNFDITITNGTIIDGTGAPRVRGDVGVRDGRVVEIGKVDGAARRTIDASGKIVCPGFVDIHTHYDAQVLWDRMLSISPWHGVTTVVMGNCGFGVAPTRAAHRDLILRTLEKVEGMSLEALQAGVGDDWGFETFPQYLDAVERRGSAINVAAFIGHTPLRMYVMGEESTERAATADEIARMRALVADALAAGAIGFASSKAPTHNGYEGRPVPSRAAELGEVLTIAGALREANSGVFQATMGPGMFFDEFAAIARETGRTVTWTALLAGTFGPGSHRMLLEQSAQLLRDGAHVVPQVSCRSLNLDFDWREPFPFEALPLFQPIVTADRQGKIRLYRDAEFRKKIKETLEGGMVGPFQACWERMTISSCPTEPALDERPLAAVANERGVHPIDFMLDLALASDLKARFRLPMLNFDEDEVAELLTNDDVVLALSDAGAHASQLCDACFSTHLLGHWVREKGLLSLERAVHMLTARPAEVLGIRDRGRLAVGVPADIVIFDPTTVAAGELHRVHDLPAGADRLIAEAYGIDAVIVNGTVVREGNRDCLTGAGALPGKLLRHGHAT